MGVQANQAVERQTFDVVPMDVQMPETNALVQALLGATAPRGADL
jgi:CheY-like chemotaxis protein